MTKITNMHFFDTICEYNITNNKWRRLLTKMPKALANSACTPILNGQFVLLFGGNNYENWHDHIYMYSMSDAAFKESKLKLPEQSRFEVIAMDDKSKDNLTTFGFIRCKCKECGIDNHLFPPEYLIRILCGYYINEFVHLINNKTGRHYKIDVFSIIDNV